MKNNAVAELQQTNPSSAEAVCDDEINLVDYFLVLWKRKLFIFLATMLPVIGIGLALWLSPTNYFVEYTYDANNITYDTNDIMALNKKTYDVLHNRFYSNENFLLLSENLNKKGFKDYAFKLGQGKTIEDNEKCIKLNVSPPFLDISKGNLTDPEKLEKINSLTASLFHVTIFHKDKAELMGIASLIRDNIEQTIPLYLAQKQLSESIRAYNRRIADFEQSRYGLELELKNNDETIAALKSINVNDGNTKQGDITLQFNIAGQGRYLPLGYQIQAAESKRIELEGTIKLNNEKYNYYKDLVDLNNKILLDLNTKLSSNYTAEQFLAFLTGLLGSTEKPQLKDYLSAYVRTIENAAATCRPVTEKPAIVSVDRGTAKKTGVVFAACLMLSIFAAFLMEGIEQNKARTLRA